MTQTIRGADLLVSALSMAGVKTVFTLSGNQIMPVFDACIDQPIDLIHVRHEASAVHMADAWGRLTGEVGVALVTAGPGHANALSALYSAQACESPMILLSGHAPLAQLGRGAFQEMAQAELAARVSKAAWTVTDAGQLGHELAQAFHIASSGRPGPVHLSLPFDVLEEKISPDTAELPQAQDFVLPQTWLDQSAIAGICDHLRSAERPLIVTGPALLNGDGRGLLTELSNVAGIPVIGMESPRGVNDPNLGRFAAILAQADLIVLLGKPLDFMLRFGSFPTVSGDCRFIHIDPDTSAIERTRDVLGDPQWLIATATADVQPAAQQLLEQFSGRSHPAVDWFEEVGQALRYRPPEWQTLRSPAQSPLHPAEICRPLQQILDRARQPLLIADGGEFGQWAQACLNAPQRLINGPAGAIGSALPMALAARVACPDATIVTLMGDGTVGFHLAEFDTAVRYRLPFVAVVGNDACWNAEHQIQLRQYGADRLIGCELLPARYDRVVESLGGHGAHVAAPEQLEPALQQAFASGQPACVNVSMQRHAAPVMQG